jgi:hypothetical protein
MAAARRSVTPDALATVDPIGRPPIRRPATDRSAVDLGVVGLRNVIVPARCRTRIDVEVREGAAQAGCVPS